VHCHNIGEEECLPFYFDKCESIPTRIGEPHTRCFKTKCCKWVKIGKFVKVTDCSYSPEHCETITYDECFAHETRTKCTRTKCCNFSKKGSLITKNSCYYIDSEVCLEYTFEKCHQIKTRKNCERKQCCIIGKKGEFERLIECKFEGREHCKETFFEKCKTINSGIYGRSVCTLKKKMLQI